MFPPLCRESSLTSGDSWSSLAADSELCLCPYITFSPVGSLWFQGPFLSFRKYLLDLGPILTQYDLITTLASIPSAKTRFPNKITSEFRVDVNLVEKGRYSTYYNIISSICSAIRTMTTASFLEGRQGLTGDSGVDLGPPLEVPSCSLAIKMLLLSLGQTEILECGEDKTRNSRKSARTKKWLGGTWLMIWISKEHYGCYQEIQICLRKMIKQMREFRC